MNEFSEHGRWPKAIAYPVIALLGAACWWAIWRLFT
jgi:hypothetical protein